MSGSSQPRILLVDSYDSFTYNLANLIKQSIPNSEIHIVKNDALTIEELIPRLAHYSAVVVGPGPGSPCKPLDIGFIRDLWNLPQKDLVPILGVCLGLQSLAVENGYIIERLADVTHGQISLLRHVGRDLFEGIGDVGVVRYHSLHVSRPPSADDSPLEELAWADDGLATGHVVMALRHRSRPFWAVQYHPESVCTAGGVELLQAFWKLSQSWNKTSTRSTNVHDLPCPASITWPPVKVSPLISRIITNPNCRTVSTRVLASMPFNAVEVYEILGSPAADKDTLILDSATNPGRFSIIACSLKAAQHISYSFGRSEVILYSCDTIQHENLGEVSIWDWLQSYMNKHQAFDGHPDIPFWGGLVGYIGYASGKDSELINQDLPTRQQRPDLSFILVERSIVLDHQSGQVVIQSMLLRDDNWINETCKVLADANSLTPHSRFNRPNAQDLVARHIVLPEKQEYISKVLRAQGYLAAGDSYELCVTARTRVELPFVSAAESRKRSWHLYKRLRGINPAPYACYMRINDVTIASSSPERFLSVTRTGSCQLRPIKGTASKTSYPRRDQAEKFLSSAKEFSENLMIVDLIRHDLHGIIGSSVNVSQLCRVEEYQTVWQLVSVVEGTTAYREAVNILGSCLPPGSMTGAPKKRSVEILQHLEDDERGIYSGVCGYLDAGGGADFSVIIRSCTCVESSEPCSSQIWEIGSGGAVTALSDPVAEWEEMIVKLRSVLDLFQPPTKSLGA